VSIPKLKEEQTIRFAGFEPVPACEGLRTDSLTVAALKRLGTEDAYEWSHPDRLGLLNFIRTARQVHSPIVRERSWAGDMRVEVKRPGATPSSPQSDY
jgi:hypothetical protein